MNYEEIKNSQFPQRRHKHKFTQTEQEMNTMGSPRENLQAYVHEKAERIAWNTYKETFEKEYKRIYEEEDFRMGYVWGFEVGEFTPDVCIQTLMDRFSLSEEEARATYERYRNR